MQKLRSVYLQLTSHHGHFKAILIDAHQLKSLLFLPYIALGKKKKLQEHNQLQICFQLIYLKSQK